MKYWKPAKPGLDWKNVKLVETQTQTQTVSKAKGDLQTPKTRFVRIKKFHKYASFMLYVS